MAFSLMSLHGNRCDISDSILDRVMARDSVSKLGARAGNLVRFVTLSTAMTSIFFPCDPFQSAKNGLQDLQIDTGNWR